MGKKYHNREWLEREYVKKGRTTTDIAGECDVTPTTISDWLHRHDIDTRSQQEAQRPDKQYTDKDWLRDEYVEKERSMKDIGDECDVSGAVILKWLRRYDIETRDSVKHIRQKPITITCENGELGDIPGPYVKIQSSYSENGDRKHRSLYVHQLLAIADGEDPYDVFSNGGHHCHHKNGIRWDNRPKNIEFTTAIDHMSYHFKEREQTPTGELK